MRTERPQNHYKTLGVSRDATHEEVRKAFRAKTKKCHPDRNAGREPWATQQMRMLIEANRVLSDGALRSAYDREEAVHEERARKRSNLRPKGRPEGASPRTCAERLLYDLLSGNVAQAIKDYELLLRRESKFDLSAHLDPRDWTDCTFLLAEGYEKRSRFDEALTIYEELYRNGHSGERSSFFRSEARERIVRICCGETSRTVPAHEAAQYYLRALALDLPRNRQAFLHKKIAECYLEIGDHDSARRHLGIAFDLKPDLKGVTKIRNRLGWSPDAAS
jgi:curved DNA-binding protein CbpA